MPLARLLSGVLPMPAAALVLGLLCGACQRPTAALPADPPGQDATSPRPAPAPDLAPATAAGADAGTAAAQRFQRGVSLGLFSEDPLFSYRGLLQEIAALGADHVELVVAYYQRDGRSTEITEHPRFTAPASALLRAIRDAKALGLRVLVFPIVRLSDPAPGEWRGTLRPADRAAWWRGYGALMRRLARLSAAAGAEALSVGSELSTLDTDREPWAALVADVRRLFPGVLTYSGNWDHYQDVALYDLVDQMGVCGYFALAPRGGPTPSPEETLLASWRRLRGELLQHAQRVGRPLLFTEVGYLSQRGAAAWPWEEGAQQPLDQEEQRRAYAAFVTVWAKEPALAGVYFWNWYGWGGPTSIGYTPRGKPAEAELRRFFALRQGRPALSPPPAR